MSRDTSSTCGGHDMGERRKNGAKDRYDEKRPVISVRVSEAQKRQLDEMARTSGKTVGQLVREGVGLERRDWRKAYRSGLDRGREESRERYAVRVPCVCGHSFTVEGQERIQEVEDILTAQCSWYHRGCRPEEVPRAECRLFKDRPRGKRP